MFLGITACGARKSRAGLSRGSDTRTSVSGASSSRNNIAGSQIEALPDGNAYTIVERLRPHWLNVRTQATPWNPEPAYARVFVDHLEWGSIFTLSRISIDQIDRIEYLSATDATIRYGLGYVGGIIRVITLTH
jgi:hypothetical protein